MRAILISAVMVLSTLVILPSASADPGYECDEQNLTGKAADEDHLQVNLRRDCSLEVVLFEGIICVGGWGGSVERDVDRHTVRAYYCDGGLGDRIDVDFTTASAQPGCPKKTYTYEDGAQGVKHTVQTHHNCRADITLNEGVTCVGAWTTTDTYTVGPVTIVNHRCTLPGGDPTLVATSAATTGPCSSGTKSVPGVTVTRSSSCHTQVDVRLYECVWNCGWKTVVDTDLLTVRQYTQNDGYETSTAASPDPCRGIWYKEGSQTLKTGTTVSYGTNLSPGCTYVGVEHGPVECRFDLKPDCEDVYLDYMACVWNGSYKTVKAGLFNIHVYTCDGRPPSSISSTSAAADPLGSPSCGIVYNEYNVGPVTVAESNPCFGVGVDATADQCEGTWHGASLYSLSAGVKTC